MASAAELKFVKVHPRSTEYLNDFPSSSSLPSEYVGCHSEANAKRSQHRAGLAVDGPQAHHHGEEGSHYHLCQRDCSQIIGVYTEGTSTGCCIFFMGEHCLEIVVNDFFKFIFAKYVQF